VADNCNAGLEIFDLSTLPDSVRKVYDSNSVINNTHNIFIDTAMAKMYACGFSNGPTDVVIFDLKTNPENPTVLKQLDLASGQTGYVHDMFVRNDTAYCSHIYVSTLVMYDMSDPHNLINLGQLTTGGYNHSSWVSDDGKMLIVADETHNQPLRIADLSANFENPPVVATIKSTLLAPLHSNSVAHNPFILGNEFVAISYYEDGLQFYKIDSMQMPFRAGYYDTRPNGTNYSGYNGAWGVYPFLPSGNILISDVDNGLFIVTPEFPMHDCEPQTNIEGVYDHFWDFISSDELSTSAKYQNNAQIMLSAPDHVLLNSGFEVESGTVLEVVIDDKCATAAPVKSPNPIKMLKKKGE
jgi:choice-of-anchor B domain-containing protein